MLEFQRQVETSGEPVVVTDRGQPAVEIRRYRSYRRSLVATIVLAFLVAACGQRQLAEEPDSQGPTGGMPVGQPDTASQRPSEPALPERFRGTAAIVEVSSALRRPLTLSQVETFSRDHFERVVFTFAGERVPGYHIEYIDQPVRQCGSGKTVPLAGDAWLLVRLDPAQAHNDKGHSTLEGRTLQPGFPLLEEMVLTCDFEGRVAWVLGLSSPNRYRVAEMSDPARLVIDIRR